MGSRTVRLDEEAEKALDDIRRATDMSISEALKRGLLALRERVLEQTTSSPWELYERIDLGPGGYAVAPSKEVKKKVRDAIRHKQGR